MTTIYSPLLLDACCAISLWASGSIESILRAYPGDIGIVDRVRNDEARFIKQFDKEGRYTKVPIDFQPLLDQGILVEVSYSHELDAELAFNLAAEGADDGECYTIAVADRLGWGVSTDDGPARTLLAKYLPRITTVSTSFLIKNWHDSLNIPFDDMRLIINNMWQRGGYRLVKDDPFIDWIKSFM